MIFLREEKTHFFIKNRYLFKDLILGFTNDNRPLHIVVAIDNFEKYIWIITVYEPSRNKWDETFSKRIVK